MKKNLKKLISGLMAVTLSFSIMIFPTVQAETTSDVFYETDFESYTGGSFCGDDTRWTATFTSQSTKYADESGNVWMKMKAGGYTAYDFAIAGDATNGVTTGKILFSFDAQRAKTASTVNSYLRYVSTEGKNVNFFFINSSTNEIYLDGSSSVKYQMTDNVPVKVDIIMDLDQNAFTLSVDGTVMSSYNYDIAGELKSLRFAPADELMVDDLRISYINDTSFNGKVINEGRDGFEIKYSETLKVGDLTADDIKVTDEKGNNVEISNISIGKDNVVVKFRNVLDYGKTVNVAVNGVKNFNDKELVAATYSYSIPTNVIYKTDFGSYSGGSFCADDARWAATYAGNSTKYTDENTNVWMKLADNKFTAYDFAIVEDATNGLKTGKIMFSFDTQRAKTTSATNSYLRYVSTESKNVNFFFINSSTNEIYLDGSSSAKYLMTDNVPVKVDIVIDLDKDTFTLVVDGNVISSYKYTISGELKSFRFAPADGLMVDNLKIAYMDETTFNGEILSFDSNSFKVAFSETLASTALTAENVTVKDAAGSEIEIKSVKKTVDGLEVILKDSFINESTYSVTLKNIKNFEGTELVRKEFTLNIPKLPVKKTLLSLDAPEEFEALGLTGFEGYTDAGMSGAKFNHTVTPVDATDLTKGYYTTYVNSGNVSSVSDNRYINLNEKAYAIGDITVEMKVFIEASESLKASGTTSGAAVLFTPKLETGNAKYTQLPYINEGYYAYQNVSEHADGIYAQISGEQKGAWHTYKTVLHAEEKTADVYIDGQLINTYKFNNYNALAESGYFTKLRLDYNVGAINSNEVFATIPYVLIDYIKVTQEYEENETGLYILQNEIQEYGIVPGTKNRQNWFGVSGISNGENLRATTYVLNLTGEPVSGYLLGAVYNGERMTVGDGNEVTAENGEVLGGSVELTVSDVSDMEIKGFLWDDNFKPFTDAAFADSTLAE